MEQFPLLEGQGAARGMEKFSVVLEGVRPAAWERLFLLARMLRAEPALRLSFPTDKSPVC